MSMPLSGGASRSAPQAPVAFTLRLVPKDAAPREPEVPRLPATGPLRFAGPEVDPGRVEDAAQEPSREVAGLPAIPVSHDSAPPETGEQDPKNSAPPAAWLPQSARPDPKRDPRPEKISALDPAPPPKPEPRVDATVARPAKDEPRDLPAKFVVEIGEAELAAASPGSAPQVQAASEQRPDERQTAEQARDSRSTPEIPRTIQLKRADAPVLQVRPRLHDEPKTGTAAEEKAAEEKDPGDKLPAKPAAKDAKPGVEMPATDIPSRAVQATASRETSAEPAASKVSKAEQAPLEPKPVVPAQPARQIALRVSDGESSNVDVQVRERAGKVQVAVRTTDSQLSQSLQSDLGDLVSRLESKGYKTEAWTAAGFQHSAAPTPGASANTGAQSEQSGSGGGSQHQPQQQQQQSPHRHPRWAQTFDETLDTETVRTESA
jgi:hypothetical protein